MALPILNPKLQVNNYIIRSKLDGEYFRDVYTGHAVWTPHKLLAAKYRTLSGAVIAWSQLGMSAASVTIEPYELATMTNPTPMRTLDAPRKVTTTVRKLSPQTLAECRRVGGAA